MNMEMEIQRFKMELLRKFPFYGDVMMHLPFVASQKVETAATDGKTIWYNPTFMASMGQGERNFVLMHELLHILLRHGVRSANKKRDRDVWNVACDIIVNNMLSEMFYQMKVMEIPFAKPSAGIFAKTTPDETVENLYEKIMAENPSKNKFSKKLKIKRYYTSGRFIGENVQEVDIPADIKTFNLSPEELQINDRMIRELICTSLKKNQGLMGSIPIPAEIYNLAEGRPLDWRKLLKEFLSQEIGDDASYATPERKYLHMDMILPGHALTEETVEEVWAFVDSSGSINTKEMTDFLTQLYHISREFKSIINICYWDTSVTDVYKKVRRKEEIKKCVPHHSGGTNINCVYQWIRENKVNPDVMLILTDGYFGTLTTPAFSRQLSRKTILVLSSGIQINADMKKIGKIARL